MSETDNFWKNRRIDTGFETAEELANCYNRENWRSHPEVQRLATEESLDTLGWIGQVKKSTVNGLMFDGHLRVELALLKNPRMLLPVDYYDLDDEETAFALTIHDAITEQAQPIPDKLAALMARTKQLTADKPGLAAMLAQLRERAGANGSGGSGNNNGQKTESPNEIEAEKLAEKYGCKEGQLWALGEHRLYIGDVANDKKTLDYLLGGQTVGLVVTDPPFTFGLASTMKGATKVGGWVDLMNSAQWFASWYSLVRSVLNNDGAMWTCCSWRSFPVIARASDLAQWGITSLLIWDKDWIGPGGSQGLRPSYEMVALFCQEGFSIPNRGLNDIWTVPWSSYKPTGHAAEKPLDLFMKIIKESGNHNIILDLFGGSGTTLVACEKLNRKGHIAEMSPKYAGLIIQRWGDLANQQPRLISG